VPLPAIHRPVGRGSSAPPPPPPPPPPRFTSRPRLLFLDVAGSAAPEFVSFPRYCGREEEEEKRQWSSVAVSDDDDRERCRYRHRHRRLRSDDDERLPIQPTPKVSRMRGEFLCARLPKLTPPKTPLVFFYSNEQSSYSYYKSPLFLRVICSCARGRQGLRCGP
jgi:hypothetical protein